MCTIIILNRMTSAYPLIVAANRDEFYSRPTRSPGFLSMQPPIFGGQDLEKGGTWLGVTGSGVVCGLVNQRTAHQKTGARSRGEVVLTALKKNSVEAARRYLDDLNLDDYNPFHILVADHGAAWIMSGYPHRSWHQLPPGLSVLTNGGLNADTFPKVNRIRHLLRSSATHHPKLFSQLKRVLADQWMPDTFQAFEGAGLDEHTQRALHAVCVKTPMYGTRSATIVGLSSTVPNQFYHADGCPSDIPFVDLSDRLDS